MKIDLEEAWMLHEYVRQARNAPEYGAEHDRDFIARIWSIIIGLEQDKGATAELECSQGELVQITRQVPAGLMAGPRAIGRELIRKAAAAYLAAAGVDDVPAIFRDAYASTDTYDQSNDRADATVSTRRDLPRSAR